MQFPISDHIAT